MASTIPFPYDQPYPQQRALMESIFHCIDSASIGCFESPTGTGKSLSIICSVLHWRAVEEARILREVEQKSQKSAEANSAEDDWLLNFQNEYSRKTETDIKSIDNLQKLKAIDDRISRATHRGTRDSNNIGSRLPRGSISIEKSSFPVTGNTGADQIDEFSLDFYDSDVEQTGRRRRVLSSSKGTNNDDSDCSDDDDRAPADENPIDALKLPQIIYCSRTHSQISQFVSEIKRTAFKDARCISLASRRNLCTNPDVSRLGSDSKISERCLELQKAKKSKSGAVGCAESGGCQSGSLKRPKTKLTLLTPCEFHKKHRENDFADHALGTIRDIEELASLGTQLKACPYYATRRALQYAHIICMPYNTLLHEDLRTSMGIKLEGRVIIFDEAHNVVEAVNHIHSANVSREELVLAEQCIAEYMQRYQAVLGGKNFFYVSLLQSVLRAARRYLDAYNTKCASNSSSNSSSGSGSNKGSGVATGSNPAQGVHPQGNHVASATAAADVANSEVLGANEFIFRCGLDNVNFFKLRRHVTETNLINKIGGFGDHQRAKREAEALQAEASSVSLKRDLKTGSKHINTISGTSTSSKENMNTGNSGNIRGADKPEASNKGSNSSSGDSTSGQTLSYTQSLRNALALVFCLTGADRDGRVVLTASTSSGGGSTAALVSSSGVSTSAGHSSTKNSGAPPKVVRPSTSASIKFVLLNPSVHFQKIVEQARSVLLVGGTLQPFTYIKSFLFPNVPKERMRLFSCGHVIDPSHVTALVAGHGPRGQRLEFTHETRMRRELIVDLHAAILQTIRAVPNGVVVFFTSYQYMNFVISSWRAAGLFDQLLSFRPVYIEPSSAVEAERVLSTYSDSAQGKGAKGAVLFSVMGGKLSEGINFSDKLARCVVMVGMPFPDSRDPVLKEKLKFADTLEPNSGKKLYEAMCMKTVNQCIGRSIRHANDYASILLLDARYSQPRITNLLPSWLASEVKSCSTFGDAQSSLLAFFAERKEAEEKDSI